jgi:orotidine-5'-phosphate decarboxylase
VNNLTNNILTRKNFLCIGLDTDPALLPPSFRRYRNPTLEFNKAVIETTHDLCVAYKLNTAFYESLGSMGWGNMEKTLTYIPQGHFTIADAKRGDIGNTAKQYAKAFFESLPFNAITVNPYMGADTVLPYLDYPGAVVIALGLTSNAGSADFQCQPLASGEKLYERVMHRLAESIGPDRLQFVVGATQSKSLAQIRSAIPAHTFLVPGVGTQGGSLRHVFTHGAHAEVGLLVNVSRAIIYAPQVGPGTMSGVRAAALGYHHEMKALMGHVH